MPKREDIKSILVIGSGPIVIGQACEFDYSGAQACKVLREEGYRVILVNSNPATIMTDPELADATYVEPITPAFVEKVIAKERPDACLPTLGGQTGLNTAVELAKSGVPRALWRRAHRLRRGRHRARRAPQPSTSAWPTSASRRGPATPTCGRRRASPASSGSRGTAPVVHHGRGAGGGIARDEDELVRIVSQGLELLPARCSWEESIEG